MPDDRAVVVPLFIDVEDVMRSVKCSRSKAYEHMRAALGRQPGERGQSRVPLYIWERYVRKRFDPEARSTGDQRALNATAQRPSLRMTQPRTKPRPPTPARDLLQSPRVNEDSRPW